MHHSVIGISFLFHSINLTLLPIHIIRIGFTMVNFYLPLVFLCKVFMSNYMWQTDMATHPPPALLGIIRDTNYKGNPQSKIFSPLTASVKQWQSTAGKFISISCLRMRILA